MESPDAAASFYMSMGQAPPGSSPEMPTERKINRREQTMAKFSIMLFGIDSYTKENMYLPYKLEAKNANAAVREARKRAKSAYPEFIEDGDPDVEVVRR